MRDGIATNLLSLRTHARKNWRKPRSTRSQARPSSCGWRSRSLRFRNCGSFPSRTARSRCQRAQSASITSARISTTSAPTQKPRGPRGDPTAKATESSQSPTSSATSLAAWRSRKRAPRLMAMRRLASDDHGLRLEPDAEAAVDAFLDRERERHDLGADGRAAVDEHERLLLVDAGAADRLPLPPARVDHPRGGKL